MSDYKKELDKITKSIGNQPVPSTDKHPEQFYVTLTVQVRYCRTDELPKLKKMADDTNDTRAAKIIQQEIDSRK